MGYVEALGDTGLVYDRRLVVAGNTDPDMTALTSGYHRAKVLMSGEVRPTALLAGVDDSAVGAICALHEMGCAVPDDVAVVGLGDFYAPGEAVMPLTTVRAPAAEVARQAVELLFWRMENPDAPARKVTVPVELVVRASTVGTEVSS